jgi:hypothetical protein
MSFDFKFFLEFFINVLYLKSRKIKKKIQNFNFSFLSLWEPEQNKKRVAHFINNNEMLKNLQFFKFFKSSKHLVTAPNLGFNYYHLENESSADVEV